MQNCRKCGVKLIAITPFKKICDDCHLLYVQYIEIGTHIHKTMVYRLISEFIEEINNYDLIPRRDDIDEKEDKTN